jgi:hypothetical protein
MPHGNAKRPTRWRAENQPNPVFIPFMLDRLVALYEDWGRPTEAADYRRRRLK